MISEYCKKTKVYAEILILVIASFSPLIDRPQKAILILILFLINIKYLKRIPKEKTIILASFMFLFMVSFILDLRNVNSITEINILNFYFPLCVVVGFLISQKYPTHDYLRYVEKIVYISAIFSFVGVFLYTFLPSLAINLPTYTNEHTIRRTAILFNIMTSNDGSYLVLRNMGIAWEPGAFQILLNIGLYSYLKFNEKIKLFKVCIYFLAIFTTKSTAGLLIFLILTIDILKKNNKLKIFVIVFGIIFFIPIISEIQYHIQNKLMGSESFNIRFEPFKNAFINGKWYIFGIGNSGFDINYRPYHKLPYDAVGQIFLRYGYFMLIIMITCLFKIMKHYKMLVFVLIISFLSQNIWYFPMLTPLYFISKSKRQLEDLNENFMVSQYSST